MTLVFQGKACNPLRWCLRLWPWRAYEYERCLEVVKGGERGHFAAGTDASARAKFIDHG